MSVDLESLADALEHAAAEIMQKVIYNADLLGTQNALKLNDQAQELIDKSKLLYAQSVIDIELDTTNSINRLATAKDEIAKVVRTITNVQKIVDLTTNLVSVAENILTGDYSGAVNTAQLVLKSI